MKKLLLGLLLAFCANVYAETVVLYNTERLGEGIVLQTTGKQLVFILFSHWDDGVINKPPTVSPPPPPQLELIDKHNFWMIGVARDFNEEYATGKLYFDVAKPDFPLAEATIADPSRKEVSDQYVVGDFLMERDGDDWWLVLESNGTLKNLTVFNSIFLFNTPLRD